MQTGTMKLRELTVRYAVRTDQSGQPVIVGRDLSNPKDTAAALTALLQDEPSEVFAILCLTTKHRVIAYHEVSRGTLDSVLVHPARCSRPPYLRTPPPSWRPTCIRRAIRHRRPMTSPSPGAWPPQASYSAFRSCTTSSSATAGITASPRALDRDCALPGWQQYNVLNCYCR